MLENLSKYIFEKHISYEFIPVICFESSCKCYVDNPYLEKLHAESLPNFICILDKTYEAWGDWSKRAMIKTWGDAEYIINESRDKIVEFERRVQEINQSDFSKFSADEILLILRELDKIATEIYHLYIFFIDECFDIDDARLTEILPEVRMELSGFVSKIYDDMDKVIEALAGIFTDLDWKNFTFATISEIEQLITNPGERQQKFASINNRPIAFVTIGNKLQVFFGDEAIEIKHHLLDQRPEIKNVKTIKGMIARKGIVSGEVLKITEENYSNMEDVVSGKENFVLVAPMTRPEMVPVLKKAIAIVTDEGGITCHAAIVSRELGIPCIVGTKIASKILKDGDRVEVDADRGLVTVLDY